MKAESNYHPPSSVEQLTEQNVKTIVELEKAADAGRSAGDHLADLITAFCGSMRFVWVHVVWFVLWIVGNFFASNSFDPFPFSLLTLIVSLEAIFLSTFILISENRQSRIEERRSRLDLQINLLAEQENTKMLQLLKEIGEKLGINSSKDPDVTVLEQPTRPEKLLEQIDESINAADKNSDR